jgi:hypothetical protein
MRQRGAILKEWLLQRGRQSYEKIRKERGLVSIAKATLPRIAGTMPADLAELSTHKNALCHPQPEDPRSGAAGAWLIGDGAQRALAVVLNLEEQFSPNAEVAQVINPQRSPRGSR